MIIIPTDIPIATVGVTKAISFLPYPQGMGFNASEPYQVIDAVCSVFSHLWEGKQSGGPACSMWAIKCFIISRSGFKQR